MSPTALLLSLSLLAGAEPVVPVAYALETHETKRIEATLTYSARYNQLQVKEWIVFIAQAPETTAQKKVKTRVEPKGESVMERGDFKRPLFLVRIPAKTVTLSEGFQVRVIYEATLYTRKLIPLAADAKSPPVPDLPEKVRKSALAAAGDVDHETPAFRAWLKEEKLTRQPKETDLDFARHSFLALCGKFKYEFRNNGAMDRLASSVCKGTGSDCGGLSALFCAVMRANGILARELVGRWARSDDPSETLGGEPYHQWHIKAEFFAKGIGWVPVDLASAVLHDKSAQGLRFFGDDPGDFLTFHLDTDLDVDTIHFGRKMAHNLQNPAYWMTGKGSADKPVVTEEWKVKELP
jgi:transglutaminase-like putative cysteine protease